MIEIPTEILYKILDQIKIKSIVNYIPYNDGEQNHSIWYKKKYPYNMVNKHWNLYYNNN